MVQGEVPYKQKGMPKKHLANSGGSKVAEQFPQAGFKSPCLLTLDDSTHQRPAGATADVAL